MVITIAILNQFVRKFVLNNKYHAILFPKSPQVSTHKLKQFHSTLSHVPKAISVRSTKKTLLSPQKPPISRPYEKGRYQPKFHRRKSDNFSLRKYIFLVSFKKYNLKKVSYNDLIQTFLLLCISNIFVRVRDR
eukprot:TRINITY_DN2227_c1_g1_i2.p2 TRINITY_DN2227_c1_g1~~TRINITY_DN2227_c1_g1_i2.p2  ORF type:complete len:143 (+),score=3.74 TRINITY_DN2227_c1_g1_i2:33-431(+)